LASVAVGVAAPLSGCSETPSCDPAAVRVFQSLPAAQGVDVEPQGSAEIGCTDTVQPSDPAAFVTHYAEAMRAAGWTVVIDGDGVLGTHQGGAVRLDRLEGNDVGVYVMAPSDLADPLATR